MKNFILFVLFVVVLFAAVLTKPTAVNVNTVIGMENNSQVARAKFVLLQQTGLMRITQQNCVLFNVATIQLGNSTYTAVGLPFVGKYLLIDAVEQDSIGQRSLL